MVELSPLVDRLGRVEADIRREAGLVLAKQRLELRRDRFGAGFERLEPGKAGAREEFERRQIGKVAVDRLLDVDLAPAGTRESGSPGARTAPGLSCSSGMPRSYRASTNTIVIDHGWRSCSV